MKNVVKKIVAVMLALVTTFALTSIACADEGKVYKIGIIQFAEHGSLDNCREGFIEGLAEAGFVEGENVEFEYQNAQADTSTTAATRITRRRRRDRRLAVSTPASSF